MVVGLLLLTPVTCRFNSCEILSYTLLRGRALSPYCVESLRWISAPGKTSDQRNRITALFLLGAYC